MFNLLYYIWFYCKRKGNKKEIISKIMMKAEESLTDLYAREGAPVSPELNSRNTAGGIQLQQQQQQQ